MKSYLSLFFISIVFFSCIDEKIKKEDLIENNLDEEIISKSGAKIELSQRSINTNSISAKGGNSIEIKGIVEFLLPKKFNPMSRETIELKYPLTSRPSNVYSNEEGSVSIALNHTLTPMTNEGVSGYKTLFENQLSNMGAKLIKSNIFTKDGKEHASLKFISNAIDSKIYNSFLISHMDGHLAMVTFNCLEQDMKQWEETSDKIIESVEFLEVEESLLDLDK